MGRVVHIRFRHVVRKQIPRGVLEVRPDHSYCNGHGHLGLHHILVSLRTQQVGGRLEDWHPQHSRNSSLDTRIPRQPAGNLCARLSYLLQVEPGHYQKDALFPQDPRHFHLHSCDLHTKRWMVDMETKVDCSRL